MADVYKDVYKINEVGQVFRVEQGQMSNGEPFEIDHFVGMQTQIDSARVGNSVTYQWVKFSVTEGAYKPDTTNIDAISVMMPDGAMHDFTPTDGKVVVDITTFSQPPKPAIVELQAQLVEAQKAIAEIALG